jgi:hypothetical protein
MTREQAMLAEHGVLPPEPCLGDTDSDCICNEADNCVFTFNPRQIDSDDDGIGDDCDIDPTIYKPCQPTASVGQLPRPGATGGSLLLGAPMPNPAIDEIAFFVEVAVESHVKIEMFDLHGRTVGIVLDRALAPGRHDVRWALREAGGGALASGVYFLRAQGAGASEIRKFTLLR